MILQFNRKIRFFTDFAHFRPPKKQWKCKNKFVCWRKYENIMFKLYLVRIWGRFCKIPQIWYLVLLNSKLIGLTKNSMFTLIFASLTSYLNKFYGFDWNYPKISRNASNYLNITCLKDIWWILRTIDFIKYLLGVCFFWQTLHI